MSVGGRTAHPDTPRSLLRRELGIWLAMLAFYVALTSVEWAGRQQTAVANSRWLFSLEKSLHIDIELGLNQMLVPRQALRVAANYEYAITYIISSFGLLVWLYLRRPAIYCRARTSFILLNIVSLVCFVVYPVAPPRLVTDLGFTDTVVLDHTWGSWGSPLVSHVNQLAAMPSLHIAWALWVSLILASIASGMLAQTVSGIHVMVTLLVILATANHYLIDAAGGAVVAVASVAVARPRVDGSARWIAAKSALTWKGGPRTATPHVGGGGKPLDHSLGQHGQVERVREAVDAAVRPQVNPLPRCHQRHPRPSRWRQPRRVTTRTRTGPGTHPRARWPVRTARAPPHALMAQPVDACGVAGADLLGQPTCVHGGYRILVKPPPE